MTKTTVGTDLLETLKILTELGVDTVGQNLVVLAVDNVALPVQEPGGNLVLGGVLDDGDNSLELFGGELTGTIGSMLVFRSTPPSTEFDASYRLFRSTSAFLQTKLE